MHDLMVFCLQNVQFWFMCYL